MDLDKLLHRPAVQMHLYGVHAREQVSSGSILTFGVRIYVTPAGKAEVHVHMQDRMPFGVTPHTVELDFTDSETTRDIQFTLTANTPTETPAWVRITVRTARGLFQESGFALTITNETEPRS